MPKIAVDTGEVYGAMEAAELIGIGYATLYRWIKNGKVIPIKLAGRTLIPKSEIERLKNKINDKPNSNKSCKEKV